MGLCLLATTVHGNKNVETDGWRLVKDPHGFNDFSPCMWNVQRGPAQKYGEEKEEQTSSIFFSLCVYYASMRSLARKNL
jgi:hypothetical protein